MANPHHAVWFPLLVAGVHSILSTSTSSAQTPTSPPAGSDTAPSVQAAPVAPPPAFPERKNHTPFPSVMVVGIDHWGEYYAVGLKQTYRFDTTGKVRLDLDHQEETISHTASPERDFDCTPTGSGFNQRTAWFPDTGIFVHGGSLQSVSARDGRRKTLVPLTMVNRSSMVAHGKDARSVEMGYVPCVGNQRVAKGVRSIGFVELGSRIEVRDATGKMRALTLPVRPLSAVQVRYHMGAIVTVPLRIVLLTIDMEKRRIVLQLQATLPVAPPVRLIEWLTLIEPTKPVDGEKGEAFGRLVKEFEDNLAQCPPPVKPIDPCSAPHRL
jgi:hypothetical protein